MTDRHSVEKDTKELKKSYRKLQRRVYILEQAMEALLEKNPNYLLSFPAFNDQHLRKVIFHSLIDITSFDFIAETGTKWGNTTAYLASTTQGTPIHSSEVIRESFLIARERLKHFPAVSIENSDSREFIKTLAKNEKYVNAKAFFYLDAHWYEDLPLEEEVEIIANNWRHFVLLIDDFKVPNDPGYGFDDYGNGKSLSVDYLKTVIEKNKLKVFFPSASSDSESGSKRGCAILCGEGKIYDLLQAVDSIKEYSKS